MAILAARQVDRETFLQKLKEELGCGLFGEHGAFLNGVRLVPKLRMEWQYGDDGRPGELSV